MKKKIIFAIVFGLFVFSFNTNTYAVSDITLPSGTILINNGDLYTNTRDVTLTLSATEGVSEMKFNNGTGAYSSPEPYATTKAWTLSQSGDGLKTVRVKFIDLIGETATGIATTITLDTVVPVITLTGDAIVNLNIGDSYLDTGATALDDIDGDITSLIIKGGTYIDTSTAGTYTITYDIKDQAGNSATQIVRTIIINNAPELPKPDSVPIVLKIYSGDIVLFDGPKTVVACAESPEADAPITVNGKCAIEQSGLSNTWTWYDSNFQKDSLLPKTLGVLDELGGNSSDNANYIYWGWFNNLNYGSTAINKHILSDGEEFLLVYNSHPLRILASKTSGQVGDTIIFTVEEKSTFNGDWSDMIWTPLGGATITLGTQSCITITDGTCSIVLNTAGSLNAIGSKSLYVPSTSIGIDVSSNNGGGGGSTIPAESTFSISKALDFLYQNQENSPMYMDWVAIASGRGSNSNLKLSVSNYLKSNPLDSSVVTDNERRAMALMALGINPYSGTEINYIKKIVDSFDGKQFGDSSLINDDIFALIPLARAGYTANDTIISDNISFILSKENSDGSWEGSVDLTAATVQALSQFDSVDGVSVALSKASSYLQNAQGNDGGWGNIFSSSWATQAMNVLGVSWTKNNKTVADYFSGQQMEDGAVLSISENIENRIWATSYAIPAVMNKSWGDILQSFEKPTITSGNTNSVIALPPVVEPIIPITPTQTLITNSNTEISPKKNVKKSNVSTDLVKPIPINSESLLNNFTANNLGASAGDTVPVKISIKKILQIIINSVVIVLTYIGKGFVDLIIYLFSF